MVEPIDRSELVRMMESGLIQLVDVLPEGEYRSSHIPRALNIPLRSLDEETARVLQKGKPIAVY